MKGKKELILTNETKPPRTIVNIMFLNNSAQAVTKYSV